MEVKNALEFCLFTLTPVIYNGVEAW